MLLIMGSTSYAKGERIYVNGSSWKSVSVYAHACYSVWGSSWATLGGSSLSGYALSFTFAGRSCACGHLPAWWRMGRRREEYRAVSLVESTACVSRFYHRQRRLPPESFC